MAKVRNEIIDKLIEMGFDEIQLFYWANDGWYLHCTEAKHFFIGQNWKHAISELKKESTKANVLKGMAGLSDFQLKQFGLTSNRKQ